MDWGNIFTTLLVGALIGWIASLLMKSEGGLVRNIVCGILGGAIGGWLSGLMGIAFTPLWLSSAVFAIVGACIVILLARLLFGRRTA